MTRKQFIASKRAFDKWAKRGAYPVTAEIKNQIDKCWTLYQHITFGWENFATARDEWVAEIATLNGMLAAAQTGSK